MEERYANVIRYLLHEKWLTVTVIGSVFTFQFISAFKAFIIDPLLDFLLPNEKFRFMNVTIRDGEETMPANNKIVIGFGSYTVEFVKWGVLMIGLYLLAKYTDFPETTQGNVGGAAIM